jgi:hypothetical protein
MIKMDPAKSMKSRKEIKTSMDKREKNVSGKKNKRVRNYQATHNV